MRRPQNRLAAQDVFSSMPPVESLKMFLSIMMTEQKDNKGQPLCLSSWDVSRAHLYGDAKRETYVRLPEEWQEEGEIGLLLKTTYGTQDAANIWGETWPKQLGKHEIAVGKANRALFAGKGIRGFCHGGDVVAVGPVSSLREFDQILKEAYDVRGGEIVGFGDGLAKQLNILNRIVYVDDTLQRLELEADRKHVDTLLKELNLETAKCVSTPRTKLPAEQVQQREETPLLDNERATFYRSGFDALQALRSRSH